MERSEFLARFPAKPPPLPPPANPGSFAPPVPSAPSHDEYFARVDVRPPTVTRVQPTKRSGKVAIVVACAVALAGAAAFLVKHASRAAKSATPVVLAPRAAHAGLPTSLGDVVRQQAEADRHAALQTVEQLQSGDIHQLAQMQPNFQWVDGSSASTGPSIVSTSTGPAGDVTIAVSASNKDVCAFGRWSAATAPAYVTMAHLPSCTAFEAPGAGWTAEAGGAASDLPDETS
jgi:hypothetical protein